MNIGERNEFIVKFILVNARDNHWDIPGIGLVASVGFGGTEYGRLPQGTTLCRENFQTDSSIYTLANSMGIAKAPSGAKADIYLNGRGYSVKSLQTSPPALINHTPRPGFQNAIDRINNDSALGIVQIEELDHIISRYWELRENGVIAEDVRNSDDTSPFREHFHVIAPILKYFLFVGTGQGDSRYPAEYLLDIKNPFDFTTWDIYSRTDENLIHYLWDRLIFSIRSKGMPESYNADHPISPRDRSISLWTRYRDGSYKGSLHVRLA